MLKVGDVAPDFSVKDHTGQDVRLNSYRGKTVVLWFYPQADTLGWTVEGIGFRDRIHEFEAKGVQVLGMSTDSVEANAAFAGKYSFPFPLLSDTTRDVCLVYGACESPTASARRITFVIGPDGKILQVYENVDAEHHVEMLLASLPISTNPVQQDVLPLVEAIPQVRSGADIPYNRSKEMDDSNQKAKTITNQEHAPANSEASIDQPFASERHDAGLAISGPEVGTLPFVAPTTSAAWASASAMSVQPSQVPPIQHSDALQLVYALGTIGYDFGTEARRDAITQYMGGEGTPSDPRQFLAHLAEHPYEAAGAIWTLNLDATPIYAIRPAGPYAHIAYERLREFYSAHLAGEVELVAIPGILVGSATLLSGQTVPQIVPELRGMASWTIPALVEAAFGKAPEKEEERAAYEQRVAGLTNFLQRTYFELRNLGLSSQERAMNFAATNVFQARLAFAQAASTGMQLDSITVERSPVCRPASDCWDVKLTFFNPARRLEQARQEYRLTVDVSDVVPVTVGAVRSWSVY